MYVVPLLTNLIGDVWLKLSFLDWKDAAYLVLFPCSDYLRISVLNCPNECYDWALEICQWNILKIKAGTVNHVLSPSALATCPLVVASSFYLSPLRTEFQVQDFSLKIHLNIPFVKTTVISLYQLKMEFINVIIVTMPRTTKFTFLSLTCFLLSSTVLCLKPVWVISTRCCFNLISYFLFIFLFCSFSIVHLSPLERASVLEETKTIFFSLLTVVFPEVWIFLHSSPWHL